jgi:cytochrome P450
VHYLLFEAAYDYPKPLELRNELDLILGHGLLAAEGDAHRKQKKLIAPGLTQACIHELGPVFIAEAKRLAAEWAKLGDGSPNVELDVCDWWVRLSAEDHG